MVELTDDLGRARVAVVAAYVNPKGDCLGGVPLELPFPGLTTAILGELAATRFDPATTGSGPVGSWVVLGIGVEGRVKDSSVGRPTFELPDPKSPPEPGSTSSCARARRRGPMPCSTASMPGSPSRWPVSA